METAENEAIRVILSTAPDEETAQRLARTLVEERLAACVNLMPGLSSVYRWEGKVESAGEVLLVMKTTAGQSGRLLERLKNLHPYEVPEGIVLNLEGGLGDYLAWIRESVR